MMAHLTSKLSMYLFVKEVSVEDFLGIERQIMDAEEYGNEVRFV